jgi:hypothetical protein
MMKKIKVIPIAAITFLLCLGMFVPASAQTVVRSEAQAKLMAKRAAQEDAYRNLAETIHGLKIDSKTTVRNFITENDQINSRLRAFLRGARVISTEYLPDGTCEVQVEIKVSALQRVLQRDFAHYGDRITAIGYGVPNPVEPATELEPKPLPIEEEWKIRTEKATGSGVPPDDLKGSAQGKLMAERAAYTDAIRNLGERIKGLSIKSETKVENFVTKSDEIETKFKGYLEGAKKIETRELEDGIVEVDVEIPLGGLYEVIYPE